MEISKQKYKIGDMKMPERNETTNVNEQESFDLREAPQEFKLAAYDVFVRIEEKLKAIASVQKNLKDVQKATNKFVTETEAEINVLRKQINGGAIQDELPIK